MISMHVLESSVLQNYTTAGWACFCIYRFPYLHFYREEIGMDSSLQKELERSNKQWHFQRSCSKQEARSFHVFIATDVTRMENVARKGMN